MVERQGGGRSGAKSEEPHRFGRLQREEDFFRQEAPKWEVSTRQPKEPNQSRDSPKPPALSVPPEDPQSRSPEGQGKEPDVEVEIGVGEAAPIGRGPHPSQDV